MMKVSVEAPRETRDEKFLVRRQTKMRTFKENSRKEGSQLIRSVGKEEVEQRRGQGVEVSFQPLSDLGYMQPAWDSNRQQPSKNFVILFPLVIFLLKSPHPLLGGCTPNV